ncbi:zinc finger MYM-type protein 2 [Tribolium castaneum]|uniref:zinc finger MYM-type protein 2 n=1 Tax=Tribolium castaneum TaxID=7070 RepID=UPI00077D9FAC|nr:PREDICTED: zinc finger MYM-type protein 2-like [Tribolium castaneum]|eukprot:XP_015837684.1 PREDICTED: zinc finger MYM-type protein 2-like [Tribolium castaneum]
MGTRNIIPKPEELYLYNYTLQCYVPIPSDTFIISKYSSWDLQVCCQCRVKRVVRYEVRRGSVVHYLCFENCLENFKRTNPKYHLNWRQTIPVVNPSATKVGSIKRCCSVCNCIIDQNYNITWHMKEFCNELCLLEFQCQFGAFCFACGTIVTFEALGTYCVSFGEDLRQFCGPVCLNKFQKTFRKCAYCLQNCPRKTDYDAASGDFFCSQQCQDRYVALTKNNRIQKCKICAKLSDSCIKFESSDFEMSYFCDQLCLTYFCRQFGTDARPCGYCGKYLPLKCMKKLTIFVYPGFQLFCSNVCSKLFIDQQKSQVPCDCCSLFKKMFDIIRVYKGNGKFGVYCSLGCLDFGQNLVFGSCDQCHVGTIQKFSFPMADFSIANFCTLQCLVEFKCTTSNQIVLHYLQKTLNLNNNLDELTSVKKRLQELKNRAGRKQSDASIKNHVKEPPSKSKEINRDKIETKTASNSDNLKPEEVRSKPSFECYLSESEFAIKLFNYWLVTEIKSDKMAIEMNSKQLCDALAQFVRETERPDGNKFAADTMYSLCLGIQRYLLNNGSDENIFYDPRFQKFQKCFEKIVTIEIPHCLVGTKIQEDLLWETKQFGDHNPDVLVHTLIYLFTKHLKLSTVDQHMGLSFRQISSQFSNQKKNSRGTVMITYCVQNGCKKQNQTFILQRDVTNPTRCLMRLCQFYLNRCPSRKKLNDQCFYLESQGMGNRVWFNTRSLSYARIEKCLNLMKTIKELSDVFA